MSASIDGQAWAASQNGVLVTGSQQTPGFLTITGTQITGQDYIAVSLYLGFISGTGTYPLGVNQGTTPGGGGSVLIKNGATLNIYAIDFTGDRGSVNVTTLTSTRIAGTFTFVAPPSLGSGAPGVKTVTNGTFDVESYGALFLAGNVGAETHVMNDHVPLRVTIHGGRPNIVATHTIIRPKLFAA